MILPVLFAGCHSAELLAARKSQAQKVEHTQAETKSTADSNTARPLSVPQRQETEPTTVSALLRKQRKRDDLPDFAGVVYSRKLKHATGKRRLLAVLWNPHRAGHPAPPQAEIERLLFGPHTSVADWFRENSAGKLELRSSGVTPWFDADKPANHYWSTSAKADPKDNDGDGWLNGHVEKWTEAIRKADRSFDFSEYDRNHDRVLSPDELAILVVIPQRGPFGTNRTPAGREFPRRQPLIVDGVRIPIIAEWYTGNPPNLGAPAHELCHLLLGAPDLYMVGKWPFAASDYSLMDNTYTTAHLDPFQKLKLGWLSYAVVEEGGEYVLRDVETRSEGLILYDSRRGPDEYFLLENRWRGDSYDKGTQHAGRGILMDGLAIWHVLEHPDLIAKADPPTGGPREWGRRGIRLIRANGGEPFDNRRALFAQQGMTVSDESQPARLRWLDGSPSGFSVTLLTPPGAEIRLRIAMESNVNDDKSRPKNLAGSATYTASSRWSKDRQFAAARAFDRRFDTRWNSAAKDGAGAWLAARWKQPVTVRKVVVREAFDRIAGFKIQYFDAKANGWTDFVAVEGKKFAALKGDTTTAGPNDASTNPVFRVDFPKPITTTGIRLLITRVVTPSISIYEIEAY